MDNTPTISTEEIKKQYYKLMAREVKEKRQKDKEFREKVCAYNRQYLRKRLENTEIKEKHLQKVKEYYEKNREEICAKRRERYARQKEQKELEEANAE